MTPPIVVVEASVPVIDAAVVVDAVRRACDSTLAADVVEEIAVVTGVDRPLHPATHPSTTTPEIRRRCRRVVGLRSSSIYRARRRAAAPRRSQHTRPTRWPNVAEN
jgi:hypothetical protein